MIIEFPSCKHLLVSTILVFEKVHLQILHAVQMLGQNTISLKMQIRCTFMRCKSEFPPQSLAAVPRHEWVIDQV